MPTAPHARQIADIDAAIAASRHAAATLATDRKTTQVTLNEHLASTASGQDRPALQASQRLRQIDDLISFEEARIASLAGRRATIVAEDEASKLADQWAVVAAFADKRLAAAKAASDAIVSLGKSITEIETTTGELNAALPARSSAAHLEEIRHGISYSLIAAGIRWPFADASSARTANNGIVDRIQRGNTHALAARPQIHGSLKGNDNG